MSMFKKIKEGSSVEEHNAVKLSEVYEKLYRRVVRLMDMDDFDLHVLETIYNSIISGLPAREAFIQGIDSVYVGADSNYFKPALDYYITDLVELLKKSMETSRDTESSWSAGVNYLSSNDVIEWNGKEYNLEALHNLIERMS